MDTMNIGNEVSANSKSNSSYRAKKFGKKKPRRKRSRNKEKDITHLSKTGSIEASQPFGNKEAELSEAGLSSSCKSDQILESHEKKPFISFKKSINLLSQNSERKSKYLGSILALYNKDRKLSTDESSLETARQFKKFSNFLSVKAKSFPSQAIDENLSVRNELFSSMASKDQGYSTSSRDKIDNFFSTGINEVQNFDSLVEKASNVLWLDKKRNMGVWLERKDRHEMSQGIESSTFNESKHVEISNELHDLKSKNFDEGITDDTVDISGTYRIASGGQRAHLSSEEQLKIERGIPDFNSSVFSYNFLVGTSTDVQKRSGKHDFSKPFSYKDSNQNIGYPEKHHAQNNLVKKISKSDHPVFDSSEEFYEASDHNKIKNNDQDVIVAEINNKDERNNENQDIQMGRTFINCLNVDEYSTVNELKKHGNTDAGLVKSHNIYVEENEGVMMSTTIQEKKFNWQKTPNISCKVDYCIQKMSGNNNNNSYCDNELVNNQECTFKYNIPPPSFYTNAINGYSVNTGDNYKNLSTCIQRPRNSVDVNTSCEENSEHFDIKSVVDSNKPSASDTNSCSHSEVFNSSTENINVCANSPKKDHAPNNCSSDKTQMSVNYCSHGIYPEQNRVAEDADLSYSSFNIYESNPFLMDEEISYMDFEYQESPNFPFSLQYNSENFRSLLNSGSHEDHPYLESDDRTDTQARYEYFWHVPDTYTSEYNEIYGYQDMIEKLSLDNSLPPMQGPHYITQAYISPEENSVSQRAWFDVSYHEIPKMNNLLRCYSNSSDIDNQSKRSSSIFENSKTCETRKNFCDQIKEEPPSKFGQNNSREDFSTSNTRCVDPSSSWYPTNPEKLWNNPVLKAREMFEKNRQKLDSIQEESSCLKIESSQRPEFSSLKSEISKIEQKYNTKIHRVNDLILTNIREEAIEIQTEAKPKHSDNKNKTEKCTHDENSEIYHSSANLYLQDVSNKQEFSQREMQTIVTNSLTGFQSKDENTTKVTNKQELSGYSFQAINEDDINCASSVFSEEVESNIDEKTDTETLKPHIKGDSGNPIGIEDCSDSSRETFVKFEEGETGHASLPDVLPSKSSADEKHLASDEKLDLNLIPARAHHSKSNSYSYSSIRPAIVRTGSLKLRRKSITDKEGKTKKCDRKKSFWEVIGKLVGRTSKHNKGDKISKINSPDAVSD